MNWKGSEAVGILFEIKRTSSSNCPITIMRILVFLGLRMDLQPLFFSGFHLKKNSFNDQFNSNKFILTTLNDLGGRLTFKSHFVIEWRHYAPTDSLNKPWM